MTEQAMNGDKTENPSNADAEVQWEVLKGRRFTLGEAIGRMAGSGALKGESPVTRKDQAKAEIGNYVRTHLVDAGGALGPVLLRHVGASDLLLGEYEQPLALLTSYIQRVLASDYMLRELVRETDMEWGRMHDERPYFEREGRPPHPDDPYTLESVRNKLVQLAAKLATTASRR